MFVATIALALGVLPAEAPPVPRVRLARPVELAILPYPSVTSTPAATSGAVGKTDGASLRSTISPVTTPGDVKILEAARLSTSDDALLAFFRKRTPPSPERGSLAELGRKLASKNVAEADAAEGELVSIGLPAVPLLRQVANNIDEADASARARRPLATLEGNSSPGLTLNAARLIAQRKPAGAARVLLGYLPYAEDDTVFQEVESAIVSVALRDGKPDPALVEALKDPSALRRGTAAQVISQVGGLGAYGAIRPLLKDPRVSVRLKVALGLINAHDAEAIPVLIDLLADLPPHSRAAAEDYLANLAGEWAVHGPTGNDLTSRKLRREVWSAWWKLTDGDKLLEEFTSRTTTNEDHEKITSLIAKLSDPTPDVREAAGREITALGARSVPLLRKTINQNHPTLSPAAAKLLEVLEKDSPNPMPLAAPRLLALRKPEGTVPALLGYLPFAESDQLRDQVIDLLTGLGVREGKADEALVKGLEDKLPSRRAGAALALCKGKATDSLPAVLKLLRDPNAEVRLRAAQGLAFTGAKESIPVLISLLGELPLETVWEVEDYLMQVAGEKSPTETVNSDPESRKKTMAAWNSWWKENGKDVELTKIELGHKELGFTLVVEQANPARGRGRVLELDAAGKIRWEVPDLFFPNDARVLRGGTVLVIEQQNRLTERDRTGKILWDKAFPGAFTCERLRNGNTFVACRNRLMVIDRAGNALFQHFYNAGQILGARRFADGSMAFVSYNGQYVRLDASGKQVRTMNLPWGGFGLGGAEILPGDRVLVSVNNFNKVVEYNAEGKPVWEATVLTPSIPYRASNGHTFVSSNSYTAITEIDAFGKVVSEKNGLTYRPFSVTRR